MKVMWMRMAADTGETTEDDDDEDLSTGMSRPCLLPETI